MILIECARMKQHVANTTNGLRIYVGFKANLDEYSFVLICHAVGANIKGLYTKSALLQYVKEFLFIILTFVHRNLIWHFGILYELFYNHNMLKIECTNR